MFMVLVVVMVVLVFVIFVMTLMLLAMVFVIFGTAMLVAGVLLLVWAAGRYASALPTLRLVENGLEPPLDPHQIASWFAYAFLLGSHYALYTPLHLGSVGIALTSVYSALALLIAVVAYRCTQVDPSDPGVLAKATDSGARLVLIGRVGY